MAGYRSDPLIGKGNIEPIVAGSHYIGHFIKGKIGSLQLLLKVSLPDHLEEGLYPCSQGSESYHGIFVLQVHIWQPNAIKVIF